MIRKTPEESLAEVERLIKELPRTDSFARLLLHLEGRREVLRHEIGKGEKECTGLSSSERSISEGTDVKG